MATVDSNQARGGRILTWSDIRPDESTVSMSVEDDKLKLSSKIKTIDNFGDINGSSLKKLDYWDGLPDISDVATALSYYEQGRTIVYTGTSNGKYRRGRYYRCMPDGEYSWVKSYIGASTDAVRFDDGFIATPVDGDSLTITDTAGNILGSLYCEESASELFIKMSVKETNSIVTAYVYSVSSGLWSRYPDMPTYSDMFKDGYISSCDGSMSSFMRVHVSSVEVNNPAFDWQECKHLDKIPMFPYDTIRPESNICYVNPTSTCFDFGAIDSTLSSVTFTLDISNLEDNQFYGNNVIYFEVSKAIDVTFDVMKAGAHCTVYTAGDEVTGSGAYKALMEVLPDGSATIIITSLSGTSGSTEKTTTAYTYGFRYDMDSTSPAVSRIELNRYVLESGELTEEISIVNAFKSTPCHEFRRCLVKDGKVNYYLYKTNSLFKEDGKTPANLTGEDGDVCVEMPKTYLRITIPFAPTVERYDGMEYTGKIDYLISSEPIPDPPTNAKGEYTTCYRLVFNGVHPLFRIGNEYELDDDGNYQYETKYDYSTDSQVSTDILLRKAADYCYAAAFATVPCNAGSVTRNATIKATATASNQTITPTTDAWFVDDKPYPQQVPGVARGNVSVAVNTVEGRSVAPYRDGSMVGVNLPGVYVNITSDDDDYPSLMPGGCSVVFAGDTENASSPGSTEPSLDYKYTTSMSFVTATGETYTKDYAIEYKSTSTVYGDVTYNAGWFLTDGNNLIAHADYTGETFSDFSTLTWQLVQSVSGVTMSMATSNSPYKLTIGPKNYGNRNSNFDWSTRTSWDTAMSYNPNWALNYRPLVSVSRANFQYMHMNNYTTDDNKVFTNYFGSNALTLDFMNTDLFNLGVFPNNKTSCDFTFHPEKVASIASYVSSAPYPYTRWVYKNSAGELDYTYALEWVMYENDGVRTNDGVDCKYRFAYVKYSKRTEERFAVGNKYWYKCREKYSNQDTGYRFWNAPVRWSVGDVIPANTLYVLDGSTYTIKSTSFVAEADVVYYFRSTNDVDSNPIYHQEPIAGGVMLSNVWYDREIVSYQSQNYAVHYQDIVPWEAHFIDPTHKAIRFYDIGYRPASGYGPTTDKYTNFSQAGITDGTWTTTDTSDDMLIRTWTYTDDEGIPYKLMFNHNKLRWTVYRRDDDWTAIYESNITDPASFCWYAMDYNTSANWWMTHRTYGRLNTGGSTILETSTTISLGELPGFATGTNMLTFTLDTTTSTVAKYTPSTGASNNTFVNGVTYYTRTGSGTNSDPYVYKALTAAEIAAIKVTTGKDYVTPGKYFEKYMDAEYHDRIWVNATNKLRIEYIKSTDTRTNAATGNAVSYDYGSCWCVVEYTDTTYTSIKSVVSSDLDTIMWNNTRTYGLNARHGLFQPLNPYNRNTQRTYDSRTGDTTNTSLVYKLTACTNPSVPSTNALMFYVDENGNYPEYLKQMLKDKYALTTHTTVLPGVVYYTRSGSGTAADPYTYTKLAKPVIGASATSYYENTLEAIKPLIEGHVDLDAAISAQANLVLRFYDDLLHTGGYISNEAYNYSEYERTTQIVAQEGVTYYIWQNNQYVAVSKAAGASLLDNTYYEKLNDPILYRTDRYYRVEKIYPSDTRLLENGKTVGSYVTDPNGEYKLLRFYNQYGSNCTRTLFKVIDHRYYGCWVIVRFADAAFTQVFNASANNNIWNGQTSVSPCDFTFNNNYGRSNSSHVTFTLNELGPFDPFLTYQPVEGAKDKDGVLIDNNERIFRCKDIDAMLVKRKSPRAYNCHTRLKQYMALMMVIDGGTFDTQSGISTGKSWLSSFDYARSTYCGRTAELGNVSGEILWDPDTDINIAYSDWSGTAQANSLKRVVAFNWRGFENPFGNIGEYEDGIIPCTRFIDGHEVTGYYECIDPGAYSDTMVLTNSFKNMWQYGNVNATSPIFSEYTPSGSYTWRIHAFPASGWIRRWDPLTFLPTRAGGDASAATYCCGYNKVHRHTDQNGIPESLKGNKFGIARHGIEHYMYEGDIDKKLSKNIFWYVYSPYDYHGTRLQF